MRSEQVDKELRLVAALAFFHVSRSHASVWQGRIERWIALSADAPPEMRARVLHAAARASGFEGNLVGSGGSPARCSTTPSHPSYQPAFARYHADPEEGRRRLVAGGGDQRQGEEMRCDDAPLHLRWLDESGGALNTLRFEVAQSQLREIGIHLVPDLRELAQYADAVLSQDFDLLVIQFFGSGDPSTANQLFACGSHVSFSGHCDTAADERLAADLVVLPLYQLPSVMAWRPSYEGPSLNPYATGTAWNVTEWRKTSG